jgi:hypothetical protein
MDQPDSPVAITSLDVSGMQLTQTGGAFTRSGRHVAHIRNVSNRTIVEAEVVVYVGFGPRSGVGSGSKWRQPLQPGQSAKLEWVAGTGRGSIAGAERVSVVAVVEEVVIEGCIYRPSKRWTAQMRDSQTRR